MAGLLNKRNNSRSNISSNTAALTQWRQLFFDHNCSPFTDKYAHWQDVERLGLPNGQHEHWKYTPLDGLLAHSFTPATTSLVSIDDLDELSLKIDACRLVFINGSFAPTLSDSHTGIWQVEVEKGAARRSLPVPIQPDMFLHLTESLSQETTNIRLPAGMVAQRPLYLLHLSQGSDDQANLSTVHYRHHLEVGANSQCQVIEHFVSINAHGHFSGARMSMAVDANAHLSHIKLAFESRASYHFGHNDISVDRAAVVRSSTFILGAGLTRHQTSAQLNGEGANIAINSLLLPSAADISDTRTYLEHNQGHCFSRQLHKVIARDHGKGVCNGLIKVAKNALKTDGKMTNNNLLLDRMTEVATQPKLEIYADDVKCSHGATVGRIDEEQIFYLRSRGIARKEAKQMIIYAFAAEVTDRICNDVVRDTVLTRIVAALQGIMA
ncbi:Fe-S cluster assembly protein SufD [Candidatus Moranella endobia]|uniref:FeS assembly protein SufD n=1 Tax=Moranella endobia (strain PCIT) TaxID=903503 RepID=F7XY28_MOREP|nr:Fe-S cluster assembly protein SufD [Candidatus Moranella endobia]AEI75004.1 FeS assembly protein SufD [Candidatus Moranella endobia PCIT]